MLKYHTYTTLYKYMYHLFVQKSNKCHALGKCCGNHPETKLEKVEDMVSSVYFTCQESNQCNILQLTPPPALIRN